MKKMMAVEYKMQGNLNYKEKLLSLLFAFLFFVLPINLFGSKTVIDNFIEKQTKSYSFYSMASYYNNLAYYVVGKEYIYKIDDEVKLQESQWLAVVSRLEVMLIQKRDLIIKLDNDKLVIENPEMLKHQETIIKVVTKNKLSSIAPELDQIRYNHLWTPLAMASKIIESSLVFIQSYIVNNWGMAIVIFAILLKILLLPIGVMTTGFQRKVSQVQTLLAPKLSDIKANYNGEEAHNRLMAAHKELGVSPFYTLKPMLGSIIQIPIFSLVNRNTQQFT